MSDVKVRGVGRLEVATEQRDLSGGSVYEVKQVTLYPVFL